MKKIGIVSLYYHNWNYGGQLQAYALCEAIREMGYQAEQVGTNLGGGDTAFRAKVWDIAGRRKFTRDLWEACYQIYRRKQGDRRDLRNFKKFEKEISHGGYIGGEKDFTKINRAYDGFITGSDQVWNPGLIVGRAGGLYGLQFVDASKRRLSYAASIGAEKAAAGKEPIFREILSGLDAISVRERSAQKYLQPLTSKPIAVVLDPTLLVSTRKWNGLAVGSENAPHLFAYFLRETNNRHDEQLHQIADQLGLPLRCIADELERYPRSHAADKQILNAGPREFLGEIRDAEMVFTNSFHGLVFSVLFHKPFWAFKRHKDGGKDSMNARVTDFLAEFGLLDRLLEDGEVPSLEKLRTPIDYKAVDHILEEKRAFSMSWLRTALEGDIQAKEEQGANQ